MSTTPKTISQRVYDLERRAGMSQDGACGAYLGSGSNCGKLAGHVEAGDPRHVSAKDPAFEPWGPDWEEK
jgi:hypothetical protein